MNKAKETARLLLKEGVSIEIIARALKADENTICQWLENEKG